MNPINPLDELSGLSADIVVMATSSESWLGISGAGFGPVDDDETIRNAFRLARAILTDKNPCSDFFGANAVKALDALQEGARRGYPNGLNDTKLGIKQSGTQTNVQSHGVLQYRKFDLVEINGVGPFFNITSKTFFGGYSPGTHQSQVFQLLHELAHMVLKDGVPLLPDDDGPKKKVSPESNNDKINTHCRDQVESVKN